MGLGSETPGKWGAYTNSGTTEKGLGGSVDGEEEVENQDFSLSIENGSDGVDT